MNQANKVLETINKIIKSKKKVNEDRVEDMLKKLGYDAWDTGGGWSITDKSDNRSWLLPYTYYTHLYRISNPSAYDIEDILREYGTRE